VSKLGISAEAALSSAIRDLVRAEVADQLATSLASRASAALMSTEEAAAFARVAAGTIRRWIREGRVAEHRAGRELRVSRSDLEQLMRRGTRAPAPPNQTPEDLAARDFG
jgi:excisionase family DNA binding protein